MNRASPNPPNSKFKVNCPTKFQTDSLSQEQRVSLICIKGILGTKALPIFFFCLVIPRFVITDFGYKYGRVLYADLLNFRDEREAGIHEEVEEEHAGTIKCTDPCTHNPYIHQKKRKNMPDSSQLTDSS